MQYAENDIANNLDKAGSARKKIYIYFVFLINFIDTKKIYRVKNI